MYTSFIGKKFLDAWNAREGRDLSARQFFDEIIFPVFFNDEKHLLHVSNSPFFQSLSAEAVASGRPEPEIRRENLHNSILTKNPNASIYVGFGAEDATATTSGQMTTMSGKIEAEEIYASWIGEALACGVGGGFYLLFNQMELLFGVFDGWPIYRKFLSQTPGLKDRQVETWNGQWLRHLLNGGDELDFELKTGDRVDPKKGKIQAIPGIGWPELILTLCKRYPNNAMTVYAYNLSSTNTTLGFISLKLPEINELYEVRDHFFLVQKDSILSDQQIQELEPFFSFKRACEQGAIGLRALEPDKLRDYLPQRGDKKPKEFKITDDKSNQQFHLFKLWIYAMLNKTELLELAGQIATLLRDFESKAERGKSGNRQLSDEIRNATSLRVFVDKLGEFIALHPAAATTDFYSKMEQVIKMPSDQLPLFVTLIRFNYNFQEAQARN
ncbi:MAG TPA: hypothetical protein PK228_13640 [Saprospiraceae bacterium]|nr:hypothetical protein [Saprospiraceae bacterium]